MSDTELESKKAATITAIRNWLPHAKEGERWSMELGLVDEAVRFREAIEAMEALLTHWGCKP